MVEFSAPRQRIVDDFVTGLKKGGHRCLWLFGPRQSGTSTLGLHAARTIDIATANGEFDELMAYGNGQTVKADALEQLQREIWKSENILRANGNDLGLWEEDRLLNERWDILLTNTDILFIDQLIMPNVEFWKKHLLLPLDNRVKSDMVTIIAGTTAPEAFGPDWATGFNAQCAVHQFGVRGEG